MKIGIYLGHGPSKNQSLKNEGLGRYLSTIVDALLKNGHEVTVACPNWLVDSLSEVFNDLEIDQEELKLIFSKKESILYRIFQKLHRKKKFKIGMGKLSDLLILVAEFLLRLIVKASNIIFFAVIILVLTMLSFLIIIVLIPPFLAAAVMVGIFLLCRKIIKAISIKTYAQLENQLRYAYYNNFRWRNRINNVRRLVFNIKKLISFESLKEMIRQTSTDKLVRMINRLSDKPDVWFCPMAFFPEFTKIKGTKVLCVPDLVTEVYPHSFYITSAETTERVRQSIRNSLYFITYSNYVRDSVLIKRFNINTENVQVIPHTINDMSCFIDVDDFYRKRGYVKDAVDEFTKINMGKLFAHNSSWYLSGETESKAFSLSTVDFILFPSQMRPNKNILNLIKAYEYLLREKFIPIKLFLTGNFDHMPEIKDYIYQHRLENDIITFYDVDSQLLATLYYRAKLVVNPTFYEGGFPYTFGESLSVGTPVVMSDIPQTREVLKGNEHSYFLFDPHNYKDIANKIQFALENRDKLIESQIKIFKNLNLRNSKDLGSEYVSAFRYFIEMDERKKGGIQ